MVNWVLILCSSQFLQTVPNFTHVRSNENLHVVNRRIDTFKSVLIAVEGLVSTSAGNATSEPGSIHHRPVSLITHQTRVPNLTGRSEVCEQVTLVPELTNRQNLTPNLIHPLLLLTHLQIRVMLRTEVLRNQIHVLVPGEEQVIERIRESPQSTTARSSTPTGLLAKLDRTQTPELHITLTCHKSLHKPVVFLSANKYEHSLPWLNRKWQLSLNPITSE